MSLPAALKNGRLALLLTLRVCFAAIATLFPFAAEAQLLPFGLPGCLPITLPCTVNTISVLGTSVLGRRNSFLLGQDLGLDRQIDLLSPPGGGGVDTWKPFMLGASSIGGATDDSWHGSGVHFGDTPPYALGATSRPAAPSISPAFGMWAEGAFNQFNDDSGPFNSGGHFGVIYVGSDYLLSRYLLIGALVQFDQTEQHFAGLPSRVRSDGWMAGPYATVRFSDNLFFQARAAWGKSQSELRLDQNSEDQFDSDRWLVRGTLLGQWRSGPWQFRPRASVGYIEETKESYTSSVGALIPGQTGSLGQAKLGPEIAYQYRLANGTVIEPRLLLEGIWNFEQSATSLRVDDLAVGPEVRSRAEIGATILAMSGLSFGASFSYDGIGSGDYYAIGGKVRVRVPFD